MISNEGYFIEIGNLFVEHEFSIDGNSIEIINVQLMHPADRSDTSRWIDIMDYLDESAIRQLVSQVDDYYIDKYHQTIAMLEDAADARRDQLREIALEVRQEELDRNAAWRGRHKG